MKIDFVKLLQSWGVKAFTGLAGFKAWLVNLILSKVWKAVLRAWNKAMKNIEESKQAQDELKKYKEVLNDPNSTAKDIRDSGRDFIK